MSKKTLNELRCKSKILAQFNYMLHKQITDNYLEYTDELLKHYQENGKIQGGDIVEILYLPHIYYHIKKGEKYIIHHVGIVTRKICFYIYVPSDNCFDCVSYNWVRKVN